MAEKKDIASAIDIKMFGEFSITINGNTITNLKGKTKRVWLLIQYLIVNRNKTVNINQIINDIWGKQPCRDPENALKNLIYRARVILTSLAGKKNVQFILFINGTYAWNNRYKCTADFELFLKYFKEASNIKNPDEKRIYCYQQVLRLYQNGFLPKSVYSNWAVSLASKYSEGYIESAKKLCGIFMKLSRNKDVIKICRLVLKQFPFEESLHKILIAAYVNINERDNAFKHYNDTLKLYYDEYGIDISGNFRPYYKKLTNDSFIIESNLNLIKKDLKENSGETGAYFCDYDMFKCIYRSQARILSRTGQSVFLTLFILSDPEGCKPAISELIYATEKLKKIITVSLRKGDVVAQYSTGQFIVMTPLVTYEDVKQIINRILKKFNFEYRKNNIIVNVQTAPVD